MRSAVASWMKENIEIEFFIFYFIACAVAVYSDFTYFGDGAFFAFAIASGHGWELLYSEFPIRLGALGVTCLPATSAQWAGASHWLVGKIYQVTFLVVPLIGMASIRLFVDRPEARLWQRWAVLCLAALAMPTFGFPTEVWVMTAFLWPALASVSRPPDTFGRLALAGLVAFVFVFSHQGAILVVPAIALLGWRTLRKAEGDGRRRLTRLLILYVCFAMIWLALHWGFVPSNPTLVRALVNNQKYFYKGFDYNVFMSAIVVVGTTLAVATTFTSRLSRHGVLKIGAVVLAVLLAIGASVEDDIVGRYQIRSIIVVLIPAIALAIAARRSLVAPARWTLAPAFAAAVVLTVNGLYEWSSYKKYLMAFTYANDETIDGSVWRDKYLPRDLPVGKKFYWDWATPYTQMMLASRGNSTTISLITDPNKFYKPLSCSQARTYLAEGRWVDPASARTLVADACAE